ncbi:FAD-dependent oxidoreductase [Marisediminicola sp. LYQ134]|uniref:flavin monoamine oxidase family protein n=1 Tax=Marisediminicola sp. LYQ134 TaxID=3391061 RepID=UPI003983C156
MAGLFALTACTTPGPDDTPTPPPAPEPSGGVGPDDLELLVPQPTAMRRSNWGSDPYALGAASYLAVGATQRHRELLAQPVHDLVFFAGEATSGGRPGTVAGARASGSRAASEVAIAATSGERIAIIGAGIAGAQCARDLTDAGFDVTILEARERVGGRIDSRVDDDWPLPVELGAGTLDSVTSAELIDALELADVATLAIDGAVDVRSPDGVAVEPSEVGSSTISEAVTLARRSLAGTVGDVSLETALNDLGSTPTSDDESSPTDAEWVDSAVRSSVGVEYGADASDFSALSGFDDGRRESDRLAVGSLQGYVESLVEDVDVWTASVVLAIVYGDEGVSIRLGTGESLQVDRVVVTVPLGVLKSGDLTFDPPLPTSHTVATVMLGMGTIDTVWLRFDEPFWSSTASRWSVVGGDLDIVEWINLEPSTGSAVLVGVVGGERALALAELSDDEIVVRARASLEPFLSS